ncbi:MAG: DUF5667 domain-containing protein [Candidatus Levyibacteriota bacterium]
MKKFIFFFTFFVFLFSFQHSFAQTKMEEVTVVPQASVDYQLPYPGLLPDSPLYIFKTIRDRIIGFLVSDPLKKAEFNLLMADKRLISGVELIKKNKTKEDLAYSTISKGENYFQEAIVKIKEAKKQGSDTTKILTKLSIASRKHKEVLVSLEKQVTPEKRATLLNLEKRVDEFEKEVDGIVPN